MKTKESNFIDSTRISANRVTWRPNILIEPPQCLEYLMEAAGLGYFMVVACFAATLIWYPGSPISNAITTPLHRRALMGFAIGLTAISIIYSPWGKRSGAHINPAVTITFLRLGKIAPWDAFHYIVFQFLGGLAGVLISATVLGPFLAHEAVNFVVTIPRFAGVLGAFIGEIVISFVLMSVVLSATNSRNLAGYTGLFVGSLLLIYIAFEAPISGMSMNPARTLGSAVPAGVWTALWVYLTAPLIGMLLAAEVYVRRHSRAAVLCAKLHHTLDTPCIFRCAYLTSGRDPATASDRITDRG